MMCCRITMRQASTTRATCKDFTASKTRVRPFGRLSSTTGTVAWSLEDFHGGTVTLVGDRLLILRESGELILAAASPDGYRPFAKAQVIPATVRAYPAISDGIFCISAMATH